MATAGTHSVNYKR